MEHIISLITVLTAAIRHRMGYVKNFTTRIDSLKAERKTLAESYERLEKSVKDLRDRGQKVHDYFPRLRRGSEEYAQSVASLEELKERIAVKRTEQEAYAKAIDLNTRLIGFAEKSLATSKRKLAELEHGLKETRAAKARMEAEIEAARIAEEKAARKAAKHAANRELHRTKKAERRLMRLEARKVGAETVGRDKQAAFLTERIEAEHRNDDFVLPAAALALVAELKANVNDPTDREIVLALLNEQASA